MPSSNGKYFRASAFRLGHGSDCSQSDPARSLRLFHMRQAAIYPCPRVPTALTLKEMSECAIWWCRTGAGGQPCRAMGLAAVRVPADGARRAPGAAAHIPLRYRSCILDAFEIYHGADRSLGDALLTARRFCRGVSRDTAGKGLLFTGSSASAKPTWPSPSCQRLVRERGVKGLFCDYRELLKNIQNSYNPQVNMTELELLKPSFAAEVLVLDDLGAQKPNEWVWDTVALILNTRYNDKLSTIITTTIPTCCRWWRQDGCRTRRREPTLGDRIGDRMLSRLAEMCIPH